MLWGLFLAITDFNWVFSLTVRQFLLAWQSVNVSKKRKRVWMTIPLCLFWCFFYFDVSTLFLFNQIFKFLVFVQSSVS